MTYPSEPEVNAVDCARLPLGVIAGELLPMPTVVDPASDAELADRVVVSEVNAPLDGVAT